MEPTDQAVLPDRRPRRGAWVAFALSVAALAGSLPLTWFLTDSPARDEAGGRTGGHVQVVRDWVNHPERISIAKFPEPKGPGLFAAAAVWGRAFGTHCATLRAMIVLAAVATLAAWAHLTGLWGLRRRFAVGIALLVTPYVFIFSQMLYTEIPSLLLTFLTLIGATCLARGRSILWGLGAALAIGAALWVRQTFLIVPAALLIASPWMGRYRLRVAAAAFVGALAVVPMLILWGGIVPPGEVERFRGGGWFPTAFTYALGALGALGWPGLLIEPARRDRREIAFIAGGILLAAGFYVAARPDYNSVKNMGLLQTALISMPLAPWLPQAVLCAAICIGGALVGRLLAYTLRPGEAGWVRMASLLALLTTGLALVSAPVFYDRYLILALAMVFAMAAERAKPRLTWGFLAFFALVTVAHTMYVTLNPRPPYCGAPLW